MRQRPSCVEATSGVHLSAPRSPQKKKKPPGTETPVNSGNKKMIKSDLMSRRRQAKTHICHSETDVTAPPAHFSLPHPLTLLQSLIHSLHSDVLSHRGPSSYSPSSSLAPLLSIQITCTQSSSCGFCFQSSHSHT